MSKERVLDVAPVEHLGFITDHGHAIIAWAGLLIAPIKIVLFNVYLLVFIDFLTGLWRSYKTGEHILSSKMRQTIPKLISYTTAILVIGMLERQFLPEFAILKIVSAYCALAETKSIFENLHEATGAPIWIHLLNKLKSFTPTKKSSTGRKKRRSDR